MTNADHADKHKNQCDSHLLPILSGPGDSDMKTLACDFLSTPEGKNTVGACQKHKRTTEAQAYKPTAVTFTTQFFLLEKCKILYYVQIVNVH